MRGVFGATSGALGILGAAALLALGGCDDGDGGSAVCEMSQDRVESGFPCPAEGSSTCNSCCQDEGFEAGCYESGGEPPCECRSERQDQSGGPDAGGDTTTADGSGGGSGGSDYESCEACCADKADFDTGQCQEFAGCMCQGATDQSNQVCPESLCN